MSLLSTLRSPLPVVAAELRPPRAELAAHEGMDAWIDTYHSVRQLTRRGTLTFLTDSAVGLPEEDNLRHLAANLGPDAPRQHIVPFLTSKHPLDYCLSYADRARQQGFPALVVLGGDKHVGVPRCVAHAWQLRAAIRDRQPDLLLGGWANPHADASWQADLVASADFTGEFFLTQIVSHHDAGAVERLVRELERRDVVQPGLFGVFYYRSASPRTLDALSRFLPVPAPALREEFATGASPVDVCARTVRALFDRGIRHVYISNLPLAGAHTTLQEILKKAGV